MKKIIIGLLVSIGIVSISSLCNAEDLCNRYVEAKEYDKAIGECTNQIESERDVANAAKAYCNRGRAYYLKSQLDAAIADYSGAIALSLVDAKAHLTQSNAYEAKNELEQTLAAAARAVIESVNAKKAYVLRGDAYTVRGQTDLANADYTKAIELNPQDAESYGRRGFSYYSKGQYDLAVLDYNKAIKLNPKNEGVYILCSLASNKVSKDDYKRSLDKLREYVFANESKEWIRTISKFYLGMDGLTEEKVLAGARNGKDENEIKEMVCQAYYYLGEKRLMIGNRRGAEEFFSKAVETNLYQFTEYRNSKAMLMVIKNGRL